MLTHIVIWKYRPDIEESKRREHIERLRRLPSVIPEIISFKVGSDMLHLERSYDTGLAAIFPNRAALDAYTVHPEHVEVVKIGRAISAHVASVDFDDD